MTLFSLLDNLPVFAPENKEKRGRGEGVKQTLLFFTGLDEDLGFDE
jgi:hypothetical protein